LRGVFIRSELDDSNHGFGKKVRNAKSMRIPYFIIIGDKDMAAGKVTLESRDLATKTGQGQGQGQVGQLSVEEVLAKLAGEIKERKA
jgi:threonyl-tRNA synthetase